MGSHVVHRKQWRIQDFPEGGAWTLQGGREHAKFSRKLHEIERIWTPRGGRASLTPPPRSANGKDTFGNILMCVTSLHAWLTCGKYRPLKLQFCLLWSWTCLKQWYLIVKLWLNFKSLSCFVHCCWLFCVELKLLMFYGHILCDGKRSYILTAVKMN